MDLSKISDVDKLVLCKRYFIGGFFILPILWLVNAIWFFQQAFLRTWFKEQKQIRYYVCGSAIGFIAYMIPIIAWTVYFQEHRLEMGSFGDAITFITPSGRL